MSRGKKLPLLTIPVAGGDTLTIFTSNRDAAYQSLRLVEDLIEALRSDARPNKVQCQLLAEYHVRMLHGETFDKVYGIDRKALRGQANPQRDWWLALDYWLRRRRRETSYAARRTVAYDWQESEAVVKKLSRLLHTGCDSHIDALLEAAGSRSPNDIIDARLAVVAGERKSILNTKKRGTRKRR